MSFIGFKARENVTTQRIHLLPHNFVVFVLKMVTYLYTLTFLEQKRLVLRQNLNTLNSYEKTIENNLIKH